MKKMWSVVVLLFAYVAQSCQIYSAPQAGEVNFPLRKPTIIPIGGSIRGITVADTWIAVNTQDKIVAVDMGSKKQLWSLPFSTPVFSGSFLALDDTLIAASPSEISLIDRAGVRRRLIADPRAPGILGLVAAYPEYLYVLQGPEWVFQVYSLPTGTPMWSAVVGRGGADNAYYDPSDNLVYVMGRSVKVFDNGTGALVTNNQTNVLASAFESGIVYAYEQGNAAGQYRVAAIDGRSQREIWGKDFSFADAEGVNSLRVLGNMLMMCGGDLVALDKANGRQLWRLSVGETFYTCPAIYNDTLFEFDGTSRTVFAVSPNDGSVIGHVRFDVTGWLEGADSNSAVHALPNGILFNTKQSVVMYQGH